jgi:hypothetical protein
VVVVAACGRAVVGPRLHGFRRGTLVQIGHALRWRAQNQFFQAYDWQSCVRGYRVPALEPMKTSFPLRLALTFALAGCGKSYHTGSATITDGVDGLSMAGVHHGGQLVYAFAWPRDIPKMDTNDASQAPKTAGIHFLITAPNGLWFNGRKVVRPPNSKVFVLRRDGTPTPVALSAAELEEVTALTNPRHDPPAVPAKLKAKVVAAFKGDLEKP